MPQVQVVGRYLLMSIKTRRFVVLTGGAIILLVSLAPYIGLTFLLWPFSVLWLGGLSLLAGADNLIPPGAPGQNLNTNDRDLFVSLSTVGLALATSLSMVFCFWNRRASQRAIVFGYFAFLVVLVSMSTANFATGDMLLNRKAQALIDLVLVVLGLITTSMLMRIRSLSPEGVILRAVIVFLLILQAIALPGVYGLLWLLNWQNAISADQTRSLNPGWISAAAALVSAGIAFLKYRKENEVIRRQEASNRIIL
jgi:hypothetical protein